MSTAEMYMSERTYINLARGVDTREGRGVRRRYPWVHGRVAPEGAGRGTINACVPNAMEGCANGGGRVFETVIARTYVGLWPAYVAIRAMRGWYAGMYVYMCVPAGYCVIVG